MVVPAAVAVENPTTSNTALGTQVEGTATNGALNVTPELPSKIVQSDEFWAERKVWDDKTEDVLKNVCKSQAPLALKNVQDGDEVCLRFAPEPSGFLHVGHGKAAFIGDWFARRYKGTLILRFDDTNVDKSEDTFEQSILNDLMTMNILPDKVEYTSEYFDKLLDYCTMFIKEDKAYCDATPTEEMSKQRLSKTANEYRSASIEENLKVWGKMQKGEAQEYVVRAKIDIRNKNGCLRDPVMYRSKTAPHFRTGTQYKVYPTYDFSCPIVDSLEGITHALRSSEYTDRKAQYNWFAEAARLRIPEVWEFSRLDFVKSSFSKRKLRGLVNEGLVWGWDDPRFPTIQGILRQGMNILALRAFIISQGASRNVTTMEWDKIWTNNRRVIDDIAPRYTAIELAKAKKCTIVNGYDEIRIIPKHKKNPSIGDKNVVLSKHLLIEGEDAITFEIDEIVTFMDWGNMKVLSRDDEGNLELEFLADNTDFKKTKKVTWVVDAKDLVPIKAYKFGSLLTRELNKDEKTCLDAFNKESITVTELAGVADLRGVKRGDVIQLERRGFYKCDVALGREDNQTVKPLILFEIPDGKTPKKPKTESDGKKEKSSKKEKKAKKKNKKNSDQSQQTQTNDAPKEKKVEQNQEIATGSMAQVAESSTDESPKPASVAS